MWLVHRHTDMAQITIDGNYQSFRYGKNSDTEDRSLFHGKSYFEEDMKLERDLQCAKTVANRSVKVRVAAPFFSKLISAQKDEGCSSLKVNLNKEKPKAAGLIVSGVLNVQCGHTMISTMTDLAKGEE
jgi:hypothetical protein